MSKGDEIVLPISKHSLESLAKYLRAVETVQIAKTIVIRKNLTDLGMHGHRGEDDQRLIAKLNAIESELDMARYVLEALREAGVGA